MQILTRTDIENHLSRWPTHAATFVDVETNGRTLIDPGARLAGLSLFTVNAEPISIPLLMAGPVAAPDVIEPVLRFLQTARLGAFHVGMEAAWLAAVYNLRRLNWVHDPWIAARMLGESGGLKDLVERVFAVKMLRLAEDLGATDFTLLESQHPQVARYMEDDARYPALLTEHYASRLADRAVQYQDEVRMNAVMAESWLGGVAVNTAAAQSHMVELAALESVTEQKVFTAFGDSTFSLGSPVQVGKRLEAAGLRSTKTTAAGTASWDAEVLDALRDKHPAVAPLIQWRSLRKRRSALDTLMQATSLGSAYPMWFTLSNEGRPAMNAQGPSLTSLPEEFRAFFPAEYRQRWAALHWAPETALWWMLGWADSVTVADALNDWPATAEALNISQDDLTAIAVQWALNGAGTFDSLFYSKDLAHIPQRAVEGAALALGAVLGGVLTRIEAQARAGAVEVNGVYGMRLVPVAEYDEHGHTWRSLLRTVSVDEKWSALKKLILLLWDHQKGACFAPDGTALAFTTKDSNAEIGESVEPFRYRFKPPTPQYVQSGATWAEATNEPD